MKLLLKRYLTNTSLTLGLLYVDQEFYGYTLEDPPQPSKIPHRTRIPSGTYDIKFREELTPLTIKYRERFPSLFTYHLELQDVPNFSHIYIHIGNYTSDTSGCILLGSKTDSKRLYQSTKAFIPFYTKVAQNVSNGLKTTLTIEDINL